MYSEMHKLKIVFKPQEQIEEPVEFLAQFPMLHCWRWQISKD